MKNIAKSVARFIVNHKFWLLIVFAVLLIASLVGMMFVEVTYDDSSYLPADSDSKQGLNAMYGEFGACGNATVMLSDTDVEEAVEFKAQMEGISGIKSVIWLDDIFLSEEIGVIRNAQFENGEQWLSDGKAVKFILHTLNKIEKVSESDLEAVMGGDLSAITKVIDILTEGLTDTETNQYGKFALNLLPALSMVEGSSFDMSVLDQFGPMLEMFYSEAGKLGNYALYQVTFTGSDYDDSTMDAIDDIRALSSEENVSVSLVGNSATTYNSIQLVTKETTISMIVAGVIVIIILLLTTTSYWEPVLLLLTIGSAILLNMGTNGIVHYITGADGISYMTQGVSSVLQLALTMDYCIYMLHRFKEEKKKGLRSNEAMVEAIVASFSPVSASSLTTIASFVALMFMSYRLGLDMGFVLAKGTVFSLICVFFLMPALILYTEKLIDKTEHKTFNLSFRKFSKGLVKSRFYVPFIIIALIVPCVYFQAHNTFTYGPEASLGGTGSTIAQDKEAMEKIFGKQNQIVVLTPIEYYNNGTEAQMADALSKVDGVSQVQSLAVLDAQGFTSMMPEKFIEQFKANGDESKYTRVIVFLDAPEEGELTTRIVEDLQSVVNTYTEGGEKAYLLGISSSTLEIKALVNADYDIITYVSLGLVALIVLITFKSIMIPIILLVVIQGSIYINMAIPYLMGDSMVFVGYMLISSILLGATIDYAILLTSRYMEHRRTMNKFDAVQHALADSSRTLITSAGILTAAGLAVEFVSTLPATKVFGAAIFRGGICSFALVLVLLPQLLLLCDKLIQYTTLHGRKIMIDNKTTLVAPEIEESSVKKLPPKAPRKKYRDMTSKEREDAIVENILEAIDNPEFDPDDEGEK